MKGALFAPKKGMIEIRNKVSISTSKCKEKSQILKGKSFSVREKILRFLFGESKRITVITLGESVEEIIISEKETK